MLLNKNSSELKATDPEQYSSRDLNWAFVGNESHPSRKFFRDALEEFISLDGLAGMKVLDIGSGVGQLFGWLKERGATSILGVEPSTENVQVSLSNYPEVSVFKGTIQDFSVINNQVFDSAFAIMVFEHVHDIEQAFLDVSKMLSPDGSLYLIVGDKDYALNSDISVRGEWFVSVDVVTELDDGSVETHTVRTDGSGKQISINDIFRPLDLIITAAEKSGFNLLGKSKILGPYVLPKSERFTTCAHLLVLSKA